MATLRQTRVRPWHVANTTLRNPLRLKGGLQALVSAGYEGDMGKHREEEIAWALHDAGVVSLSQATQDVTSIARKWRSGLVQLGFIWPDVNMLRKARDVRQDEIGPAFTRTPNGRRLLQTSSLQAEQEVILRSLAALRLPSLLEPGYTFGPFSPLRHVIRILRALDDAGEEPYISRLEMAGIVILTDGSTPINTIVHDIRMLRGQRKRSDAKRRFDAEAIRRLADAKGQKAGTLYDYQDLDFRYFKATGLFQSRGRGITLVPEKRRVAFLLADESEGPLTDLAYLLRLGNGAELPTDTQVGAVAVLADLHTVGSEWRVEFDESEYDLSSPQGISLARHNLEQLIFDAKENEFAKSQVGQIDEILAYLEILDTKKKQISFGDDVLTIPREEQPAYFEWLLWRVILALDGLVVPPKDVRRFKIDQDFLPIGTASGGGPDVIAEYEDAVLVVEVTLTENSRQEAAEGEPVRRHVADVLEEFEPDGKAVYGLFIARRIDTNTAQTFKMGIWYRKNDEKVTLDVVPLTLGQLRSVLRHGVATGNLTPALLIDVIELCVQARQDVDEAPQWKARIAELLGA